MCEIISCSEQNECDSLCLPANVTWEDLISNSLRSGCKDPFSDTQYAQRLVVCWGFFEAEPWQVLLHFIPPQHHSSVFCCCPPFRQQYWCFEFSSQIVHMKVFHTVKVYFYTIDLLQSIRKVLSASLVPHSSCFVWQVLHVYKISTKTRVRRVSPNRSQGQCPPCLLGDSILVCYCCCFAVSPFTPLCLLSPCFSPYLRRQLCDTRCWIVVLLPSV